MKVLPALFFSLCAFGQQNFRFEGGELGGIPPGWFCTTPNYGGRLTDQCSKPGVRCVEIQLKQGTERGAPGVFMQNFDATPYRNKFIRYRARVRVDQLAAANRGQLWLRVDRPNKQMGFFDNMGDRPILSTQWHIYEISGEVAADAVNIALGLIVLGESAVYFEPVSFEALGDVPAIVTEPARPLSAAGLGNLTAFARLYGYVRFFHPSDEAAQADWNSLAVGGVRAIEGATSAGDLARRLQDFFQPVAPAVRVFTGAAPKVESTPGVPLLMWEHHGFGTGNQESIYRSNRVKAPDPPPEPFLADLGGGVRALVPLTAAGNGKTPAEKKLSRYSGDDRATRLADVVIAWNVFQHFYPYFDVVRTDWPAELEKGLRRAASDQDGAEFVTTLKLLVAALHDGHGNVYAGQAQAVLPVRLEWVEGRIVLGDTADAVLRIDGKPAMELLERAEAEISGATPQWIRGRALAVLGSGPTGSEATLEVEPFSSPGTSKTLRLTRGAQAPPARRPEKVTELEPGIWYVDLTRIDDKEWATALARLEKARGIIFDLRGYPRLGPNWLTHLSNEPLKSAQWHVPVVTRPDHVDMKFERSGEWNLSPSKPYLQAKRAVLTDGSAISYAESTMGIVEHYKLADIVGSTTAGTNGNVNPIELPGGYRITWTGMKVLKQDGSRHHGVGIKPTAPVERTRAGIAAGKDEVLERGVSLVR